MGSFVSKLRVIQLNELIRKNSSRSVVEEALFVDGIEFVLNGIYIGICKCLFTPSFMRFKHEILETLFDLRYDDIVKVEVKNCDVFQKIRLKSKSVIRIISYTIIQNRERIVSHIGFNNESLMNEWKHLLDRYIAQYSCELSPHFDVRTSRPFRNALVVVNPFSGQGNGMYLWKNEIVPILHDCSVQFHLEITERVKHATEIAIKLNLNKYDLLVAVGGDGLISELITGLSIRRDRNRALKLPISHIPTGTSNALAAAICFQCNEPFRARGPFYKEVGMMLARPLYLPLRICHVETECDGDRTMFLSATWGLIADIDIGSERFRWAGMVRLHMEAFLRIMDLPNVAKYKGRISYLPVTDSELKRATKLRHFASRKLFGKNHFIYEKVRNFNESTVDDDSEKEVENSWCENYCEEVTRLNEDVPHNWVTFEGQFVSVCVARLSHLGSDLPYIPSSRLDDDIIYLTFIEWGTVESRIQVASMLLSINESKHLDYPCLHVIPVRACRIEPLDAHSGYIAVDGEKITPGTSFQVVPTKYCATVVSRNCSR